VFQRESRTAAYRPSVALQQRIASAAPPRPAALAQAGTAGLVPARLLALQRTYGNRAVRQLVAQRHEAAAGGLIDGLSDTVTSPIHATREGARPVSIQRKVGFEFEVPNWSVNTATPLAKNTRLMNGNGWYLQNDVLGFGGSDPEFVTRPVDETDEGWRQLDTAMQDMNVTLAALDGAITTTGSETVANLGGSHPTATITGAPPFIGDPQVSAGINLSRLPTLLTALSHDPNAGVPRTLESQQLAAQGGAEVNLSECAQRAAQICNPGGPRARSIEYEGLIALMGSFVHNAANMTATYMKQAAHVMSRSNLPDAIAQLPEANRRGRVNAATLVNDVLLVANVANTQWGGYPELFPAGAQYDLTTAEGRKDKADDQRRDPWRFVGRNAWIRGIANGTDLLRGLQGSSSWGAMGLERVGPEQTGWFGRDIRPKGIIVELRDVKMNVPWDQWYPFAIAVFHYIREVNDLAIAAPQYQGFPNLGQQGLVPPVPGAPPAAPPGWWERRLQDLQDLGAWLNNQIPYTYLGG